MDENEELRSILPFLPVVLQGSELCWPTRTLDALEALSKGPNFSGVDSGFTFFDAILDLRTSIGLPDQELSSHAAEGYSLFFDDLITRMNSKKWFAEVLPALAVLLLRLPSLLQEHYECKLDLPTAPLGSQGSKTTLRVLIRQKAGFVLLSQELISGLLSCSLLCLFPSIHRDFKHLPAINFDHLFGSLYTSGRRSQEQKIKCLQHYFERISESVPRYYVSFERKMLCLSNSSHCITYPDEDFWGQSAVCLSSFEVSDAGCIEDQQHEALEVDFANKYIGGGALHLGCVQEEIRFMINPELIAGMLFLPCMDDNEAVEITGAERFCSYSGYGSTFLFLGDYVDSKRVDFLGRKKTRIVAIDALPCPGSRQYALDGLLRESNKAFCGFFDQWNYQKYQKLFQNKTLMKETVQEVSQPVEAWGVISKGDPGDSQSTFKSSIHKEGSSQSDKISSDLKITSNSITEHNQSLDFSSNIGVATGNWGCGAFGGDPGVKCMIQWVASSQALRPFIVYFTFKENALKRLPEVTQWITAHAWTVGDLWNMLVEYSSQRLHGRTCISFLDWLIPPGPSSFAYTSKTESGKYARS